jgi:hypothetical protein
MAQPTGRFTWGLFPCPIEGVRAEDRKYQKTLKERESESAFVRAARIRKYENDRAFVGDIPEAYHFKLLGERPWRDVPLGLSR